VFCDALRHWYIALSRPFFFVAGEIVASAIATFGDHSRSQPVRWHLLEKRECIDQPVAVEAGARGPSL